MRRVLKLVSRPGTTNGFRKDRSGKAILTVCAAGLFSVTHVVCRSNEKEFK